MRIPGQGLRRRAFLRRSIGALLAGHPGVVALGNFADQTAGSSPLKPESYYRAGAAAYASAMDDLARLASIPVSSSIEMQQASLLIDRAMPKLDQHFSWMVMAFVSDPGFAAGVKDRVRDKTAFKALVRELLRDPNAIMSISGTTPVRARIGAEATLRKQRLDAASNRINDAVSIETQLDEIKAHLQVLNEQNQKLEDMSAEVATARKRAEVQKAAACAVATAAIVACLLVIVAAIVNSVATFGVSQGDVDEAAGVLASAYHDEGGTRLRLCLDAANERHRTRIESVPKSMPTLERRQIVLRYQALWLADKSNCSEWAPGME